MIKIKSENTYIYGITCFAWAFVIYNMHIGFKSYVDEAFFIIGLNPEQNLGIQHTQFFQIARFIFKVSRIEPTILHSRIIAFVCMVATLYFFSVASYRWLNKKGKIKNVFYIYLSLVFLYGLPIFLAAYEVSLTFNHLLVLSVTGMFSCYLLWDVSGRKRKKLLYLYLIGFFSFLAIMNYFPSGILISLLILFLIMIKETDSWKNKIAFLFLYTMGFISFAISYNFLIYPLQDALKDIITSIKSPAFGTGGYDLLSYIELINEYGKNIILIFLSSVGVCFFYYLIQKQTYYNKQNLAIALFTVILSYLMYEISFFKYNILLMPIIFGFLFYHMSQPVPVINRRNKKQIVSIIQGVLFLFFPIIALQGTNVSMNYKMAYTVFIWAFILAFYLFRIKDKALYKFILYLAVSIILVMSSLPYFLHFNRHRGTYRAKYRIEENKQFDHIIMKKSQIDYFRQVDSLLKANNFDAKKDRILAFDYDYATLHYLNVTNYGGLMHRIDNLPYYKDLFYSHENAPEFILIAHRDGDAFLDIIKDFKWNFPDECTEYEIGDPDPEPRPHPRSLIVKHRH
ncbi:MAG: hypothetical protein LBT25_13870 [Candidatus Symbiothrix sp.]|jgi:hypothetical protein|nr:hypothetical protein [Candidatus Symbiothrix sp.]